MNKNNSAILKLIKAGLLSEKCDLEGDLDWNYIQVACYRQGITNLVYQAVKNSSVKIPTDNLRLFQAEALSELKNDRTQLRLLEQLFKNLEENKIVYLPLKGSVLKYMYSKTEFRRMGDADIYIEPDKYDAVRSVMEQMEFAFIKETDHELVWEKKDELTIEFHKAIVAPKYGMAGFYKSVADKALNSRGSSYRADLDITDHLVYSVVHFANHSAVGNSDIRNLMDIYLLNNDPGIDRKYLEGCLDKLQLTQFFAVICKAIEEWFGDKPFSKETELLLNRILSVSERDKEERFAASSYFIETGGQTKVTFGSKLKYLFKKFFLPYKRMSNEFPVLRKVPILLPVFWIWRPIHKAIHGTDYKKRMAQVSTQGLGERTEQYKNEMEMLGLDSMIAGYEKKHN